MKSKRAKRTHALVPIPKALPGPVTRVACLVARVVIKLCSRSPRPWPACRPRTRSRYARSGSESPRRVSLPFSPRTRRW